MRYKTIRAQLSLAWLTYRLCLRMSSNLQFVIIQISLPADVDLSFLLIAQVEHDEIVVVILVAQKRVVTSPKLVLTTKWTFFTVFTILTFIKADSFKLDTLESYALSVG